ncbi:hypothetical protein, partial [Streptococcus pseudopneumoniae]
AKGIDEATKKAIEENVKEVNPGSTVVVDENGNATVTTPATGDKPGNTATIPAKDLVKNEADASQAGAGNNVNKPADKVLVDPAKGIDEATKKAIEENVKEVNPGSTVVVDENGNATVTTPATGD